MPDLQSLAHESLGLRFGVSPCLVVFEHLSFGRLVDLCSPAHVHAHAHTHTHAHSVRWALRAEQGN